MRYFSTMIVRTVAASTCFIWLCAPAAAAGLCNEPKTGTDSAPLLSPPLGKVVTGAGRLPFYSAPDPGCSLKGVFVLPKDSLIAYAETPSGWTSVMYMNPKTGSTAQGWVRSSRLKTTGTMGPAQ